MGRLDEMTSGELARRTVSRRRPAKRCKKCGAVEQEREVMEQTYRWRKEGPPPGKGWVGPVIPYAEMQIYERTYRERFFDCKFVCPNVTAD